MKYRINRGVALFRICDSWFLFASRSSDAPAGILITVSDELLSILKNPQKEITESELDQKTVNRLNKLVKIKYLKEC